MRRRKFGKLDFKKFHPAGNLGNKLKTAADIMLTKNKIPFVNKNEIMKNALRILNYKKLSFLVITNNEGLNAGVFTDGDLKRLMEKKSIDKLKIKNFMTKNPITVDENMMLSEILELMNKKKITNVCVYNRQNKKNYWGNSYS